MNKEGIVFWEEEDPKGIKAKCSYNIKNETYLVEVSKDGHVISEGWRREGYQPRFGMDLVDSNYSLEIAEKLAQQLETSMENK